MNDPKDLHMKRIMIAAVSSGSGKTLVTTGLLRALKMRGLEPASFKCGPDYIDPMFHKKVLGIESRNLDTFFSSPDEIRELVASCGRKIAVIEGVMGIYDGISPEDLKGSCYEIAGITKTPVILIVNAAGSGRTMISVTKGILSDDTDRLIKGIILNRMSSSYYEKIRQYLASELNTIRDDVTVLGNIPDNSDVRITSRYLGLTMPQEISGVTSKIDAAAKLITENTDIDGILRIASGAGSIGLPKKKKCSPSGKVICDKVRMAVATDEAFCFYYAENLKVLNDLGVELVPFSPIHDDKIPDGVSGILLGGGYPELHLKELSQNTSMLRSVKDAIGSDIPSVAECGGFMYLHDMIKDREGYEYKTVGVIDGVCSYTGHLVDFGYVEVASDDSGLGLCGMRGHEFHYYDSTRNGSDLTLFKPSSKRSYRSVYASCNRLWGFAHFYYPSDIGAIEKIVQEMRRYGK